MSFIFPYIIWKLYQICNITKIIFCIKFIKKSSVTVVAGINTLFCKTRKNYQTLQNRAAVTIANIDAICHPMLKPRELLNSRARESDFVVTVHLYAFTYERAVSRNVEWPSNSFEQGFAHPGYAPKSHRIPARRDLNGLEIFHRSLATPRRRWDLIRLFAKNEMIGLYERETFDPRCRYDHDDERESIRPHPLLQINPRTCFFSAYISRANSHKKILNLRVLC